MPDSLAKEKLEQVIIGMIASSRNLMLYPLEHPTVKSQIQKLLSDLLALLEGREKVSVAIIEEVLVFEGVPFYQPNIAVRDFQRRLEERGMSAVEFCQGLEPGELQAWVQFLLADAGQIRELGASRYLEQKGVTHIKVRDVQEVYNRALNIVSEILKDVTLGKIPKIESARKAVEDLTGYVLTDRPALLALTLLKSYDNYLFNHSVNVSVLSLALAAALKVPKPDLHQIGLAGLLHDLGKILTPKNIIHKPYDLTQEEWEIMKQHPVKSAEILQKMQGIGELCIWLVYEHHARYDRRGYPILEEGHQIHPYSKIIAIADVYDAVTTLRPYQKPFHPREAIKIMESLAGNALDPVYFQEFVRMLGIYPVGSLVRLDTGEVGLVIENNAQAPLHPKVRIIFDPSGKKLTENIEIDLAHSSADSGERNLVAPADPLIFDIDFTKLT